MIPFNPPDPELVQAVVAAGKDERAQQRLSYQVTLITPMLGGGTQARQQDQHMPFRSKAIKGHLRWWWRLLARHGDLDEVAGRKLSELDDQALRYEERVLWGLFGMDGTPILSAVRVEVGDVVATSESFKPYQVRGGDNKWIRNDQVPGPGYAMFPAQRGETGSPPQSLLTQGAFKLHLQVADSVQRGIVAEVVRHWATFGGVGARTRRGLGAVSVHRLDTPGNAPLCALGANQSAHPHALRWAVRDGTGPGFACATEAWSFAVEALRTFRQGVDVGRNEATGFLKRWVNRELVEDKKTGGRSRWPEPDTIRHQANVWFAEQGEPKHSHPPIHPAVGYAPRAAFGLPITERFRGDQSGDRHDANGRDPIARTLNYPGADRMASPLILRPVAKMVNGQVKYIAFAALIRRDGNNPWPAAVTVSPQIGKLNQIPTWNPAWNPSALGANFRSGIGPLDSPLCAGPVFSMPSNAVEAFLNYFHNQ